jgi:hypothetical protein
VAVLLVVAGLATISDAGAVEATRRCATPSTLTAHGDFNAAAKRGEVWALPLGEVPPADGQTLKVVWRVTGKGPLRVHFRDPSGRAHPLAFGPQRHGASSFRHPGAEWGTGFAFDAPGCWTVRVTRAGADATVGIRVI